MLMARASCGVYTTLVSAVSSKLLVKQKPTTRFLWMSSWPSRCRRGGANGLVRAMSIVTDTGVEPAIKQIDGEIDEHDHGGHKEDDALDDREVAGADSP